MLRIALPAEQLVRVHFAVSPVVEATSALLAAAVPRSGRLGGEARRVLAGRRLEALAALSRGYGAYLPEFLTPQPDGYSPDLRDELHRIATAPTEQIQREIGAFLAGGRWQKHRCPWLPQEEVPEVGAAVRARLERGERELAGQLADELEQFWRLLLAPRWASVRRGLDSEVDRQSGVIARHGMAAVFPSLHSSLSWQDGAMRLDSGYEGQVDGAKSWVLVPSRATARPTVCAPLDRARGGMLVYPARPADRLPLPDVRLGRILGHTRLALLKSLGQARTTTELADLHHLAASSASYHVTRLYAAGFVDRRRSGRAVYYWRTARAEALLDGSGSGSGSGSGETVG